MEKFYLGMDIGTNSVGMACTDEQYRLLRASGKDCWSVRLFDPSETAVERRSQRTARRRLARRRQRIVFLQQLFAEYIADENFFLRLDNSQYFTDDKNEKLNNNSNNLFADETFTDKDYHKAFPTIYHLRKALMTQPVTDLRLYYLALHHIIKYRGHFLFDGGMADIRDVTKLFNELNATCRDIYEENVPVFKIDLCEQAKILLMQGGKDKVKNIMSLFGLSDPVSKEIINGICGYKINPFRLLGEPYKEEKSFSMKETADEVFEGMQATYKDDFALLQAIRNLYNFITFEKILEGRSDISSAMIALYDKHRSDLKRLKKYVKNNADQATYNRLFKSTEEGANYVNFVGYTKKGGDKKKVKKCKDEEFFAYLKKFITQLPDLYDCQEKQVILQEIEEGIFLPKILHADNGLFPHQVNEDELNKIVANMIKNCPQTQGIADKILSVFTFRIPYYVGPLTGKNSWAVRDYSQKITPWNFTEVVDGAQSNEEFMRRLTNKCTYLHGENVLPKASVCYQKFNVLNQINKLKINEIPITEEFKQRIYQDLFLTRKKVTDAAIKDLYVRYGQASEKEKSALVISGKDGPINASMSSYVQLKAILGDFVDDDLATGGGVCENIILWHTLNTDKNIVADLIRKNYGHIPQIAKNIKQLKGLSFKDFGKLSRRFLQGIQIVDKTTGQVFSVLDLLYETNQNLNEILFNEAYNLREILKEENGEQSTDITLEDIQDLYVSPAVHRGIWQSLKMADEYVQAIGKSPDKIFVEVTREDGVKGDTGRTVSRQKQLLEKYKSIGGIATLTAELREKNDMQLRQERLYLYFRQLGKCMYSGEQIDLAALNTNQYDVDHVLPRSYIKDDSLDNKVLVLRSKNAQKTDIYPIPYDLVSEKARNHWQLLLQKGLISQTTYDRLTRTAPLTESDYNDFINRQKTITDQTVKAVAELLKRKYPEAKIVYSKARNVNEFKQKFSLYKCRETNDLHHARDAYLNVVVGNVYDTCFSVPWAPYRQDGDKWRFYNLKTMFTRNVSGAWVQDNNQTLSIVLNTYKKTGMAVTRYAYCNKGGFYNQTVYGHTDTGITAPRKNHSPLADTSRYGGYKSQATAYFAIVRSEGEKGKILKTIEAVPVMVYYQSKQNSAVLQTYFASYLHNPIVLVPKIKIKQLICYNGTPCYIAGVTGDRIIVHNGVQLFTDNKTDEYVNALGKLVEMAKSGKIDAAQEVYIVKTNRDGVVNLQVDAEQNVALYDLLFAKLSDKKYAGLSAMANYARNLRNGFEKFISLTVLQQAETLLQIIKFFKCNAETSNLTTIGGSGRSGTLSFNKIINEVDFSIIHQSPCGLTVKEQKV